MARFDLFFILSSTTVHEGRPLVPYREAGAFPDQRSLFVISHQWPVGRWSATWNLNIRGPRP